ncbi:MAG: chorismate synthase [Desulfobacterales bacterium]
MLPGIGEPVFDKLDAEIAKALMSIGAVKGVEIGAGFAAAAMRGAENNDPITPDGFSSITPAVSWPAYPMAMKLLSGWR